MPLITDRKQVVELYAEASENRWVLPAFNAEDLAGEWMRTELLGNKADQSSSLSIDYFTSNYRQKIIFKEMKKVVTSYLEMWYR